MKQYKREFGKKMVVATYTKGGKLKAVKMQRGELVLAELIEVVGATEEMARATMVEVVKGNDAFYDRAKELWLEHYTSRTGLKYRFTGADGVALASIGKYLQEVNNGTANALQAWQFILTNWNRLPPFYRNIAELKLLNSQLNGVINEFRASKNRQGSAGVGLRSNL